MLGENGYPETPDWLPESRCDCHEARIDHFVGEWKDAAELRRHADPPAHEVQPLTWDGDDS